MKFIIQVPAATGRLLAFSWAPSANLWISVARSPCVRPAGWAVCGLIELLSPDQMKCYSIILGARNTRSKHISRDDEIRIQQITARYFPGGFSILNVKGGWFDPVANRFIREEARQLWICTTRHKVLRQWVKELGRALRQREIIVMEFGRARRQRITGAVGEQRHEPARKRDRRARSSNREGLS